MESGADRGEGGIRVESLAPGGTPEQVERDLGGVHGEHNPVENSAAATADDAAISVAIIQGTYFETPSTEVNEVNIHQRGDGPGMMSLDDRSLKSRIHFGISHDPTDMSESVFGPALLELRRVFSDNKNSAMDRNRRSGRIDKRVLGRRAWSGDDRLFAKKRIPEKKDYAVLIGIDISSSTFGDNIVLAKRAAYAQAELCARLGIKFSVFAHSHGLAADQQSFSMDIHVVKDWDQPWNPDTVDVLSNLVPNGGNLDGHTMEYYRRQLDTRTESDRVIMYYTDGKMPASNHDEELEVLQREIKTCKRLGYTLMAVGIRTDSPIQHGLDTVQVDEDEDIKRVVTHLGTRLKK